MLKHFFLKSGPHILIPTILLLELLKLKHFLLSSILNSVICTSGRQKLLQFGLGKSWYLLYWEAVDIQEDLHIFSNVFFPVLLSAHLLNFGQDRITVVRCTFPWEGISDDLCGGMGLYASRDTFWHFSKDWSLVFLPPLNANPRFIVKKVTLFSPKVKQFEWGNSTYPILETSLKQRSNRSDSQKGFFQWKDKEKKHSLVSSPSESTWEILGEISFSLEPITNLTEVLGCGILTSLFQLG